MPNNHEWQCWHGGICPVDPETEVTNIGQDWHVVDLTDKDLEQGEGL